MADDDDDEKLFLRPLDAVARGQKVGLIWYQKSKFGHIFRK